MSRPHSRRPEAPPRSTRVHPMWGMLVAALLACLLVPGVRAQASGTAQALTVTSSSKEAVQHFWMAWDELNNVNPAGAVPHLEQAMSLDPGFGLAHVLYGFGAPGLSPDERNGEVERGMEMLKDAPAQEMFLALSWREWNAGRLPGAIAATHAAAELAPDDARLAFQLAQLTAPGAPGSDQVATMRSIVQDHPDFAPAYNNLAYASWAASDHEAALAAVRKYAELRSDHPNPHDSYAELLQWDGQYDQAAAEYRKALEIDPSFYEASLGLAELSWLAGEHEEARSHIKDALATAPQGTPRVQVERALAHAYLMDGKSKEAMSGLTAAARDAEASGNKGLAAAIHHELAVADAMFNKGKDIDDHLSVAAALGGADTPGHQAWTALAYASANRSEAGAALDRLEKTGAGNAGLLSLVRTGRAMMLHNAGQHEEALTALGEPGDDMGRSVQAACLQSMKRGAEAKKMEADLTGNPNFSFYNAMRSLAVFRIAKV